MKEFTCLLHTAHSRNASGMSHAGVVHQHTGLACGVVKHQKKRLRLHLMGCHKEEFLSSLRVQSITAADALDYYEEAVKVKCCEHISITSLSQDRRAGALM